MFVHPSEKQFYIDYYAALEGATILGVMVEPDGTPMLAVKMASGSTRVLHVLQDTEGNGPGFIHGLPIPAKREERPAQTHVVNFRLVGAPPNPPPGQYTAEAINAKGVPRARRGGKRR